MIRLPWFRIDCMLLASMTSVADSLAQNSQRKELWLIKAFCISLNSPDIASMGSGTWTAGCQLRRHRITTGDLKIIGQPEYLAIHQKAVLIRPHWVRFQLDHCIPRQCSDAPQPLCRLQRRQGKEKVRKPVPSGKHPVDTMTVEPIREAFLARLKGEAAPNRRACRE